MKTIIDQALIMPKPRDDETVSELTKRSGHRFISEYDKEFGELFTSIYNTQNGKYGFYWEFYVNKIISKISADEYKLNSNDEVIWLFMKPYVEPI